MTQETGGSSAAEPRFDRTIVLVGLMGAGKTTIGRRLARRLRMPFHDADEEIERAAARSVSEIFETYGEQHFRDGERRVIARLLKEGPAVLATGGGAFMEARTRALIKKKAVSIWLRVDLDVLAERVSRRDTRPLLKTGDPREILQRLSRERDPIYAEADIMIDSGAGPHDAAVKAILQALRERGLLAA